MLHYFDQESRDADKYSIFAKLALSELLQLVSFKEITSSNVLIWDSKARPHIFGISDCYTVFLEKKEKITKQHVEFIKLQEKVY
jgi:hypothetical protein